MGLYDMIMLKDNHIDYAGGIENAISFANDYLLRNNLTLKIEIEARSIDDVKTIIEIGGIDRIMLINGKYETERVVGTHYNPTLASDGKTIIYERNNRIMKMNGSKPGSDAKEIADDVRTFAVSSDGKHVYFTDRDRDLYYVKGTGKPKKMGVFDVTGITLPLRSSTAYFIIDRELYTSSSGGKHRKLSGADEVTNVWALNDGGVMYVHDWTIYRSDGKPGGFKPVGDY
jgi:hypothetical protein